MLLGDRLAYGARDAIMPSTVESGAMFLRMIAVTDNRLPDDFCTLMYLHTVLQYSIALSIIQIRILTVSIVITAGLGFCGSSSSTAVRVCKETHNMVSHQPPEAQKLQTYRVYINHSLTRLHSFIKKKKKKPSDKLNNLCLAIFGYPYKLFSLLLVNTGSRWVQATAS